MSAKPIPAPVLFDALAALRAIKDAPGMEVPSYLWKPAMHACARLEAALQAAGLTVPVQQVEEVQL